MAMGRKVEPMTLPPKVELQGISQGQLLFRIRQDWQISGHAFKTGSLLSMPLTAVTSAAAHDPHSSGARTAGFNRTGRGQP